MNLLYGQIVEIVSEDGMQMGKIRVAGAFKKISLELLSEAQIGDRVLVCDGIAITKEEPIESLSEPLSTAAPGQFSNPPIPQYSTAQSAQLPATNEAPNESVQTTS